MNEVGKGNYCVDIDECAERGMCSENAECQNSEGSYLCNCFDGFGGDFCTDIDECNSTNSCDLNAQCRNTDGSYECSCKDGFYGAGNWCSPGRCPESNCPENQKCVSPTTIKCECQEGFRFNNLSTCVDIDECTEKKCDARTDCVNTIGSYVCKQSDNLASASTLEPVVSTVPSTKKAVFTSFQTTTTAQTSLTTKRAIPTSYRLALSYSINLLSFSYQLLHKMNENIWQTPREAFCLLNQNITIIISSNQEETNSSCILYDHVSKVMRTQGNLLQEY